MQVEELVITPALAAQMLEEAGAPNWRTLRPTVVARYALDMTNGRWRKTGEAIKYDSAGHLVDGQHRLRACIKANKPFPTLVIRGIESPAVEAMDMGLKRSLADFLHREGFAETTRVAAAIVLAWQWETGHLLDNIRPGPGEALEWFRRHPEIVRAGQIAWSYRDLRITGSAASVFTWRAIQIDPEEETLFRHALISGEKMERGHPVLLLRNWLTLGLGRERRNRPDNVVMLAMMIKAWNAVMTGTWPRSLSYRSTGMVREVFPMMVGKDVKF